MILDSIDDALRFGFGACLWSRWLLLEALLIDILEQDVGFATSLVAQVLASLPRVVGERNLCR
jgi:hypothetical protein